MTVSKSAVVRVVHRFSASPERVFDAWLDPKRAGQWLFATPQGEMVRVEIDARVGGSFAFVDRRDGEDVEHIGTYLELDRPRRLVFTFGVPKFSAETTRVVVEILPVGAGCELTLTHEGVLPDYASRTQAGWTSILDGLARTLTAR
ncbi:MAG: SRPBCC family protein [Myxococcota bacterium]